jgi:hypothetical protein
MESARKKKRRKRKGENTIADEQPSTLGVPNFKKVTRSGISALLSVR